MLTNYQKGALREALKRTITMKKALLVLCMIGSQVMMAQLPLMTLDQRQEAFNNGSPLPADTKWKLAGPVRAGVDVVRVEVREKGTLLDRADFSTEMELYKDERTFEFVMAFPLREGKTYDFHFVYGKSVPEAQAKSLSEEVKLASSNYLDQIFYTNGKKILLRDDPRAAFKRLNEILNRSLHPFVEGGLEFSPAVLSQLRSLDGIKLSEAKHNVDSAEGESWRDSRKTYMNSRLQLLKDAISIELADMVRGGLKMIDSERVVNSYPVEKTPFVLPLNVGYGVVFDPRASSLNYATAPYAGISFPLGARRFGERISVSAGVFITNFEYENGDELTGPFINRPFYLALGVKALRVVRFNVGAAAIQEEGISGASQIRLQPMVGLAVEINVWAGFGKRK